jgi:hypothetical protein
MKTVTIHFTGGEPMQLSMPAAAAEGLLDALLLDPRGIAKIEGDNGSTHLINLEQMTYAEATPA